MLEKGQIYMLQLNNSGSVQTGLRPVVIVQNNIGNEYSPTTIIACMTTKTKKLNQSTHIIFNGIPKKLRKSVILCEQLYTVNKSELGEYVGQLNPKEVKLLNQALKMSLAL